MRLLVNQMQNQDPINPQSNEELIAQLAQFSSLEQMTNVNDSLLGLAMLQQSNALMSQLTDSSALIGQQVNYLNPNTGGMSSGTVESVKIEEGIAVLNVGGTDVPLMNVSEITGAADILAGGSESSDA